MVQDILMYMDRTYVKQNQKKPVASQLLLISALHTLSSSTRPSAHGLR